MITVCDYSLNHTSALRKLNEAPGIELFVMDHVEIMDEIKNDGIERPEKIRLCGHNFLFFFPQTFELHGFEFNDTPALF